MNSTIRSKFFYISDVKRFLDENKTIKFIHDVELEKEYDKNYYANLGLPYVWTGNDENDVSNISITSNFIPISKKKYNI